MPPRSADYTKARTLEELRRRAANRPLRLNDLPAPVRRAVQRHWGSMTAARKAAHLPAMPPGRRRLWTPDRIVAEIRRLQRAGQHLSCNAVAKAGRGDLVSAAWERLGGWTRALDLAGVSFTKRRPPAEFVWDAASVVSGIRSRHRRKESLAVTKTPSSLTSAANRLFGSWRDAIEAAGLDYDEIRLVGRYSDEHLLAWLRTLARAHPEMRLHELEQRGEHVVACRRRWGSLEAAADAAGLDGWPVRVRRDLLSRTEVIRAIRRRARSGEALNFTAVRSERGTQLADSALKVFASWDDAVAAAGLPPQRSMRSIGRGTESRTRASVSRR